MASQRPVVRRSRLGSELQRLRKAAGVSMEQAAERLGGDKPKISRIENGKQGVTKAELEVMFNLYEVTDAKYMSALERLRLQRRRKNWWSPYEGDSLGPNVREHLVMESEAVRIHTYQPLLVPGLLQTPDYARALHRGALPDASDEEIDALVALRMERQRIFERPNPPQYVCVLDEAVLRRPIGGPKIMEEQFNHLLRINNPPHLTIQIIPFTHGWHPGLDGPFMIYMHPDPLDLDVTAIEYMSGSLYLEDNDVTEKYRLAFDGLRMSAASSRESMEMISAVSRTIVRTT